MKIRCRKCSGHFRDDERLSYLNPSSQRRRALGGNPFESLAMKVVTPLLPNWLRPIAPDSKPNVFEKVTERIQHIRNVHYIKHRKPAESPVKTEPFKQVPKIVARIEVVEPVKKREGTWEGGNKFNCCEQRSRTFSPRRKRHYRNAICDEKR
jgi:hypothetical protein